MWISPREEVTEEERQRNIKGSYLYVSAVCGCFTGVSEYDSPKELFSYFSQYGPINVFDLVRERSNKKDGGVHIGLRGHGYVQFRNPEDLVKACEGTYLTRPGPYHARTLVVEPSTHEFDVLKIWNYHGESKPGGYLLPRVSLYEEDDEMIFESEEANDGYWENAPEDYPCNDGSFSDVAAEVRQDRGRRKREERRAQEMLEGSGSVSDDGGGYKSDSELGMQRPLPRSR